MYLRRRVAHEWVKTKVEECLFPPILSRRGSCMIGEPSRNKMLWISSTHTFLHNSYLSFNDRSQLKCNAMLRMRRNKYCIAQNSAYCKDLEKHFTSPIYYTQAACEILKKKIKWSPFELKYSDFQGIIITVLTIFFLLKFLHNLFCYVIIFND